ncbi:tetratricopeptide repeat protein [Streptomyces sp. UNOB3_S3]|nr:tetratricopeptide repeat protein [Streptomyces sp. UNOB3_S3]
MNATWQESADACADLAWQARTTGSSALLVLRPEQITSPGPDPVTARAHRHLYLAGLRYDFRCPSIEALVHRMPPSVVDRLDAYSRAMWAFALLGQSRTDGFVLMDEVLVEAGDHPKTLQVLLHGLWLGHRLPGREERMLRLLDLPPFAGRADPIALFRKAAALRGLGNYRKALEAIDQALDLLPPGDPAVHADLVRERSLITAAHDWARLARTSDASAQR